MAVKQLAFGALNGGGFLPTTSFSNPVTVTIPLPPIGGVQLPPIVIGGGPGGPSGGGSGVCAPGTHWRGIPWEPWVCDPDVIPGGTVGPGNQFNPTGSPPCIFPWRRDPVTGECALFVGDVPGPDPSGNGFTPSSSGSRIHGEFFHRDSVPVRKAVSVRRCPKGAVLGKDGWCHPRGSIANKERQYPRPTPPLGTSGQMKALMVASRFGNRLKSKRKQLKKLSNLFKTC